MTAPTRDMRPGSPTTSPSSPAGVWSSGEATPVTSPPSSRGESPEPIDKPGRLEEVPRHSRSEAAAIVTLPSAPPVRNICFVGAGFVGTYNPQTYHRSRSLSADTALGGPTAALIAYHNPSMTVNVVDLNADRIAAWNANHLPIHETGLPKIVRIARDGTNEATVSGLPGADEASGGVRLPARKPNLFFSTNVTPCIASADIIFICVNTPTKTYGVGAGASADLCALESATRTIAMSAKIGAVIVEKSTVPCGTARIISDIVSFPEGLIFCRHVSLLFSRSSLPLLVLSFPFLVTQARDISFWVSRVIKPRRGIPVAMSRVTPWCALSIQKEKRKEETTPIKTTSNPPSTCRG